MQNDVNVNYVIQYSNLSESFNAGRLAVRKYAALKLHRSNKNCSDQHIKQQQRNNLVVRLDFWSSAFLIQNDKAADTVFWLLLYL